MATSDPLTPPSPPTTPVPRAPRRLTRSAREKMWAGVAGGLGEYFDVDPVLVRLIFVAATVFTGGLTVPLYILFWIVMPRDDRPAAIDAGDGFRAWSREFEDDTRQFARQARRMAHDITGHVHVSRPEGPSGQTAVSDEPPAGVAASVADPRAGVFGEGAWPTTSRSDAGAASSSSAGHATADPLLPPVSSPSWVPAWSEPDARAPEHTERRRQGAGIVLIALGLLFMAGQAGLFRWINWAAAWPLILVAVGVALLLRQNTRGRA